MSDAQQHPVHARLQLRAALELLARHANPPHQPQAQTLDLAPLLDDNVLQLAQLDLTGAWLRGLQFGKAALPDPARLVGCEHISSHAPRGAEVPPLFAAGYSGLVDALAVLPDGRFLSAGWDNTVRLWDLTQGCLAVWATPGEVRIHASAEGVRYHRDTPWQTVELEGPYLPCDPQLYRYTRYLDTEGRTQPAWRYPELIAWEDGNRTLLLKWPEGYDWQQRLGRAR